MLKLKKVNMICLCVALLMMSAFLSVGFAAVTDDLSVTGSGGWYEPEAVRIIDINLKNSSNVSGTPSVTQVGFVVFQHGDAALNTQRNSYNPGGMIEIEVTVRNNSGVGQYFTGHTASVTLRSSCVISYSGISVGDLLPHNQSRTFTIKFQNTDRTRAVTLNGMESTLNFSPDFDESYTEDASANLAQMFENVLKDLGPNGLGDGITFKGQYIPADRIMDTLAEYMTSVDTGGYIGNVGNASQDQKDLISAIFGENMTMQIGNQHYSVSVLVKNQQIDNRGQNDMVLYITADQLAVGSGYWSNGWKGLTIVPVYGIVFINNGNSYTACDHLFAGEAPVCNFGGDFGSGNVGNFNTNLWNSTDYPDLRDTSGGDITQNYITTNGELDEAYQRYVRENP